MKISEPCFIFALLFNLCVLTALEGCVVGCLEGWPEGCDEASLAWRRDGDDFDLVRAIDNDVV